MALLSVTGLAKRFKSTVALRDIGFELAEGEVLALLGQTGAGKTTTLRCLAGLEQPDAGRILLDGRDVTAAGPRDRDVAVVFEGFNLLPPLSVYDNIAFPLRSPVYRESEAEVRRRVGKTAEDLHISHLFERRIEQLSGGERQRVAIARALVRKPRVLLLDEPLSALDLKLREALQDELKEMHRTHGSTVIYASHDFPSVAQIATRVALIDRGRILQAAPLGHLLAEPASREVGQLIGSPSMALFEGRVEPDGIALEGYGLVPTAAAKRLGTGAAVALGIWPEDIEVSDRPRPTYGEARVYATDFRGRDKALEVRFGQHRFRKAVALDLDCRQNDPVWFRLPGERAYLFDSTDGRRVSATGEATP